MINCGGQCNLASSFQNQHCAELIQQCNQAECNQRIYNLSTCISTETGIIITDMSIQPTVRDDIKNITTMEQLQASIPNSVYKTETTNRTEAQNVSPTTKALSNTEVQVVIGALAGLLMVLLVMAIILWIWICWWLKTKKGLKRGKQQARYRKHVYAVKYTQQVATSRAC